MCNFCHIKQHLFVHVCVVHAKLKFEREWKRCFEMTQFSFWNVCITGILLTSCFWHVSVDCHEILLPEDGQLSGFVPLLALPLQPVYVSKDTDKVREEKKKNIQQGVLWLSSLVALECGFESRPGWLWCLRSLNKTLNCTIASSFGWDVKPLIPCI